MVLIVQSQCLFLNSQMQMAVKLTPIAYALTQQSGNERFRTLVAIFGCYLKVFSDEPLPQDISRYVERLGNSRISGTRKCRTVCRCSGASCITCAASTRMS